MLERVVAESRQANSTNFGAAGGAGAAMAQVVYRGRVDEAEKLLEKANAALRGADAGVRSASIPLLQQQVAEATDASAAATARYERALGTLNDRLKTGKINEAQYRRELEASTRTRDRTLDAISKAERDASRKPRAPRKPKAPHVETAAEAKRRISYDDDRIGVVDDAPGTLLNDLGVNASIRKSAGELDNVLQRSQAAIDEFFEQGERRASDLAGVFYDALTGRAGGFWDQFKRLGLTAVAQIAARLVTNNGGAGGSFGDILKSTGSSVLGSVFGGFREAGGPVDAGKAYVVGEARAELFVPRVSGTILPSVGGGGGQTVNNYDLRGSLVTEDVMRRIDAGNMQAMQGGAAMGRAGAAQDMRRAMRPLMPRSPA